MSSILEVPIAEDQVTELLKQADDELTFLWRESKIPAELQARMIQVGFTELTVFCKDGEQ